MHDAVICISIESTPQTAPCASTRMLWVAVDQSGPPLVSLASRRQEKSGLRNKSKFVFVFKRHGSISIRKEKKIKKGLYCVVNYGWWWSVWVLGSRQVLFP